MEEQMKIKEQKKNDEWRMKFFTFMRYLVKTYERSMNDEGVDLSIRLHDQIRWVTIGKLLDETRMMNREDTTKKFEEAWDAYNYQLNDSTSSMQKRHYASIAASEIMHIIVYYLINDDCRLDQKLASIFATDIMYIIVSYLINHDFRLDQKFASLNK